MKTYFLRLFRTTFLFIFSPSMLVLEFFYNLVGRSLIEEKFDIDIKVKENKDGERD